MALIVNIGKNEGNILGHCVVFCLQPDRVLILDSKAQSPEYMQRHRTDMENGARALLGLVASVRHQADLLSCSAPETPSTVPGLALSPSPSSFADDVHEKPECSAPLALNVPGLLAQIAALQEQLKQAKTPPLAVPMSTMPVPPAAVPVQPADVPANAAVLVPVSPAVQPADMPAATLVPPANAAVPPVNAGAARVACRAARRCARRRAVA